jgi:diguanylate cyclase (GGDEF)-like protein
MENAINGFPAGKLASIGIIGALCGAGIFFILNTFLSGTHPFLCLFAAVLLFLLIWTAAAATLLFSYNKKILRELEKFKELSSTDALTELYNRSYLEPFLESEVNSAKKENQPVSVMMVDMDHFKEINDSYGHTVGDHILAIFAQVILKCLRKTDIIARYGGDEFIVVLPNTDTETAKTVADRIRNEVAGTYIPPVDNVVISSIHCSIGISTYPVLCDSKNTLLKTSDLALYMAKHSGRNCTKIYQGEPVADG